MPSLHDLSTFGAPSADDPSPPRRLLLVEDDPLLVRFAERVLGGPDFSLDVAGSAERAREYLAGQPFYDAMLLDVQLPDHSGLDLLREMRASGDRTPVLVLTGLDTDEDVVEGLDAGADDYLVKPVGAAVLKARLRAVYRRRAAKAGANGADIGPAGHVPRQVGVLTVDALVLDRLARRVTLEGREVDLTPKEFSLLEQLMLRAGDVVARGELLEQVWQVSGDPGSNVVDAHVARLRQKLRGVAAGPEIRTVRGVGFQLGAPQADDRARGAA